MANADSSTNSVRAYNATTGAPVAGFVPPNVSYATNVALSGNTLYVAGEELSAYNATTGARLSRICLPLRGRGVRRAIPVVVG